MIIRKIDSESDNSINSMIIICEMKLYDEQYNWSSSVAVYSYTSKFYISVLGGFILYYCYLMYHRGEMYFLAKYSVYLLYFLWLHLQFLGILCIKFLDEDLQQFCLVYFINN